MPFRSVPAAAAGGNSPQTVCAGYAGWARIDANNNTSYSGAGYAVTATGIPGKSGSWTSSPAAAVVLLHAGDALKAVDEPRIVIEAGDEAEVLLFDLA